MDLYAIPDKDSECSQKTLRNIVNEKMQALIVSKLHIDTKKKELSYSMIVICNVT